MALLLDLANILGGFLLAAALLSLVPQLAEPVGRAASTLGRFRLVVAVLALVAAGYWILVHLTDGPHLFHFEVVGLLVGLALLRPLGAPLRAPGGDGHSEVVGSETVSSRSHRRTGASGTLGTRGSDPEALPLLLGVLGIIAMIVGIQGLFTPDG